MKATWGRRQVRSPAGKTGIKKDIGLMAISYGNVYVARNVAFGVTRSRRYAFQRRRRIRVPSPISPTATASPTASTWRKGLLQQQVRRFGHWPLMRYKSGTAQRRQNLFNSIACSSILFAEYRAAGDPLSALAQTSSCGGRVAGAGGATSGRSGPPTMEMATREASQFHLPV